jgi:uncharacterized membrane protein
MDTLFERFAEGAATAAEMGAILIVTYGVAEAFLKLVMGRFRPGPRHGLRKAIWRDFGTWLLLVLEFELAADIIQSVLSPTWQEIGELGAIALIRTFLNFFLERDLEHAAQSRAHADRESAELQQAAGPSIRSARDPARAAS